jgi:hypothetical protein
VWREHPQGELYRKLFALRRTKHRAVERPVGRPDDQRAEQHARQRVQIRSSEPAGQNVRGPQSVTRGPDRHVLVSLCHGADTDYLANEPIKVDGDTALTLDAWSARIFVQ